MKGNPIFNGTEPETRMYSKPFEELYYEDTPRIAELRESVRRAKRSYRLSLFSLIFACGALIFALYIVLVKP